MSENQDELKVQIKAWLKQQNISRNDFAAECFVSPNTVRNWLAKVAIPKDKEALIRLMMEKRKGRKTERGGKSQLEALCRHAEFRGLQTHRRSRQKGQHDGGGMGGSHPDQGRPEEDENYYDDSSLPEDVSLAAEVPEEYGAPRRSGPSSSPPFPPAASRGNKSWRAWHPADVPPACRLPPACCSAEGFPRRREHRSPLLCAESTFLLLSVLQKFYFR